MSNPIRLGICGLGRIGSVHCTHFAREKERYRIVALCDTDRDRLRSHCGEFGGKGYVMFEEFLQDAEMEVALIATRSLDHAWQAEAALKAGKMVLLEKPIGVTANDYAILRRLNREYEGRLFFLHNFRFEPAFQAILGVIRSGLLGEPQIIKLNRHHGYRRRADWQSLLACGGGQLSVWGPHVLDQAIQCLGAPVSKVWSHLKRTITPGDADDHVRIILVGENGVQVELEISDVAAIRGPYAVVYGTRGTLYCPNDKEMHLRYLEPSYQWKEVAASSGQPPPRGGYGGEEPFVWREERRPISSPLPVYQQVEVELVHHFYEAVRNGVLFPIRNEDALEVVRLTEKIKRQNPQFDWIG